MGDGNCFVKDFVHRKVVVVQKVLVSGIWGRLTLTILG